MADYGALLAALPSAHGAWPARASFEVAADHELFRAYVVWLSPDSAVFPSRRPARGRLASNRGVAPRRPARDGDLDPLDGDRRRRSRMTQALREQGFWAVPLRAERLPAADWSAPEGLSALGAWLVSWAQSESLRAAADAADRSAAISAASLDRRFPRL
jgi:hypothetical protein